MPASPLLLPALALSFNAFVWGVSWWPLRELQRLGLHPIWATAAVYTLAVALILARWPRALGELARAPVLWVLLAAAGTTNAAFNWGVVIGDVVRVVLLFYLMPLWAVLLARALLGEALTRLAALRVVLALGGAAAVLWQPGQGWPLPREPADWLGLLGGFAFALNNVLLRREAARSQTSRALAMFAGGLLVPGTLGLALSAQGLVPWPPVPAPAWLALAGALSAAFLFGNWALQYGAARLPANVTAVVMLTEVLFASASALWLGGGRLSAPLALGGSLILGAALLSVLPARGTDAAAAACCPDGARSPGRAGPGC